MKTGRKCGVVLLVFSMLVGLTACGNTASGNNNNDGFNASVTNTNTTTTEQSQTPTTTQPTEQKEKETYYTNLIDKDTETKQNAASKRESDLELANIMLRECTKKLSNCTVEVTANTDYKCNDVDKNMGLFTSVPTNANYTVVTRLCFDGQSTQLSCKQEKTLYRDKNLLGTFYQTLMAQATSVDAWSDKMNFLLYNNIGTSDLFESQPLAAIQDELTKGEVYKYISKDVRSCLNRFLSLTIDSIEEKDGVYIIKGKTKDIFVIVDEIGGNAITNNATLVNAQGQKNAGLMNTTGILVKHNVDVTLYVDKATETLVAIEASSENSLNEEVTTMKGIIKDVGTTVIEPVDLPEEIPSISTSEIPTINAAITYSR